MREVYRMENSYGEGPFDGQHVSRDKLALGPVWQEFIADTAGQSHAIMQTLYGDLLSDVEDHIEELRHTYGLEPVFGAPDLDCFERWFPPRYRSILKDGGFLAVLYEVPEDAVREGASKAELVFVPVGQKTVLDIETFRPRIRVDA